MPDWLEIARLGRLHGLKGEILAAGEQAPEWYVALGEARVRLAGGAWFGADPAAQVEARELRIATARRHAGRILMGFEGLDSANAAMPLVNGTLCVRREQRPAPGAGEYWLADLIGCEVVLQDGLTRAGQVTGWQDFGGGNVALEVETAPGREPVLVPFARRICVEVDLERRRIRIDPPEGLLELNADSAGEPRP
jgi:16S rRNA processing protein RimM